MNQADIGVTGLSTMGRNLARNLARHGYSVAVHNRTERRTTELVTGFASEGTFLPSVGLTEFVGSLRPPRTVLVMVKAGSPTDSVIGDVAKLMEPGDIIVDGGNAHFMDTRRREAALREQGLHFLAPASPGARWVRWRDPASWWAAQPSPIPPSAPCFGPSPPRSMVSRVAPI